MSVSENIPDRFTPSRQPTSFSAQHWRVQRDIGRIQGESLVSQYQALADAEVGELRATIRKHQMASRIISYGELSALGAHVSGGDPEVHSDIRGMIRDWADVEGEIFRSQHGKLK